MAFMLGAKSLSFVTRVDPRMIAVAKYAIGISEQDFCFTEEQSRDQAEEAQMVARGVSKTMHSHHLINQATGFSGAVDAVPWSQVRGPYWDWDAGYLIAVAFKKASIALKTDVTWGGGDWWKLLTEIPGDDAAAMKAAHGEYHGFDAPHFELGRN
jgi:hypothetical protein